MTASQSERSVLIYLPPGKVDAPDAARIVEVCRWHFGEEAVRLAAPAESLAHYRALLPDCPIVELDESAAVPPRTTIVLCDDYDRVHHDFDATKASGGPDLRIYLLHSHSRLKLLHPSTIVSSDQPALDAHVFSRLSSHRLGYINFPFGALYADFEVGPLDEFGFRMSTATPSLIRTLAQRDPSHKVVAVFGGSAAFGYYDLPHETFASRLETKLNQTQDLTFTVLNFGIDGHVVIQEIITYMLFGHAVRPDIVIAHDGYNDVHAGLQDDPFLVNHQNLIYPRFAEEWSKILHGTVQASTPDEGSIASEGQELNLPHNVIRAYLARKRQFDQMVRANGGLMLWGLQPLRSSKPRRSERENQSYRQMKFIESSGRTCSLVSRAADIAYDQLSNELSVEPDITLVNFHEIYRGYDESMELLWDHCHSSPDGEEIIAAHYHDVIVSLLGDLRPLQSCHPPPKNA
jgi:hypothetical protein